MIQQTFNSIADINSILEQTCCLFLFYSINYVNVYGVLEDVQYYHILLKIRNKLYFKYNSCLPDIYPITLFLYITTLLDHS